MSASADGRGTRRIATGRMSRGACSKRQFALGGSTKVSPSAAGRSPTCWRATRSMRRARSAKADANSSRASTPSRRRSARRRRGAPATSPAHAGGAGGSTSTRQAPGRVQDVPQALAQRRAVHSRRVVQPMDVLGQQFRDGDEVSAVALEGKVGDHAESGLRRCSQPRIASRWGRPSISHRATIGFAVADHRATLDEASATTAPRTSNSGLSRLRRQRIKAPASSTRVLPISARRPTAISG